MKLTFIIVIENMLDRNELLLLPTSIVARTRIPQ